MTKNLPLEGLRAVAVLLVFLHHSVVFHQTELWWKPGPVGVRLFFVLSGYLITGILLRARETRGSTTGGILRAFYARRALRILPIAIVVVAVAGLLDLPGARAHWLWYDGFASNLLVARQHAFEPGLAPFWSLAVEEQFYLAWPLLILTVPRRHLPACLLGAIALATLCRAWLSADPLAAYVLTIARLDALALGGYLALSGRTSPRWWVTGAIVLMIGLLSPSRVSLTLCESGAVILSACVLDAVRRGRVPGMAHPALVWIGGLSYGLYVWHAVLLDGVHVVERWANVWLREPSGGLLRCVYALALTIPVAAASYYGFERRINERKTRFPYVPTRQRPTAPLVYRVNPQ